MTSDGTNNQNPWQNYYGPNYGYVQEQYERYLNDPGSVDATFRELFDRWGSPPPAPAHGASADFVAPSSGAPSHDLLRKVVAAEKLVWNIRTYGHLAADIDPLELRAKGDTRLLDPSTYHLTEADLEAIPASLIWEHAPSDVRTGKDAIKRLLQTYTKTIAFEFSHVHQEEERDWLNRQAELAMSSVTLSPEEKKALLRRLTQVEQFEVFLHRTFVGQKRFSIEGVDMLVPMIDGLIRAFADNGIKHVLMGMAHRGRLNVLAHVLGKPYGKIFSEFHHSPNKDMIPSEGSMGINYGWTGDVKYHLGADYSYSGKKSNVTRVTLANNPSHLEFVNPVVEGFTRAAQEDRTQAGYPRQDYDKAATILVHGDAAFPGEGIVAETLNFNQLPGYRNGGTVHIIANNRIGFTTESHDSRSTLYASDLAKGFEIPIVHVNADDPIACIAAVRLASEYRLRFKKDFLIDLVGYRRFGHNESDDPEATQPLIYQVVRNHPTIAAKWGEQLVAEGLISKAEIKEMQEEIVAEMKEAYDRVKRQEKLEYALQKSEPLSTQRNTETTTAVPLKKLKEINAAMLERPEGFTVYPKLQRILERRANALEEGEKVDWAHAEALAFATILADGKPIRLTGQDSERGTFAHRHLVLHDVKTGETFSPLHRLPQAKASFAIHNSPLSEASVLGFEYGYNVFSPETLVLWEAQFGDFTNAAQVIIDQFISAGRVKWSQRSSIVLLLPHGYEGQGPEHSSARLERFLQMAAEDNWTVANLTTAAQYFHLLRRQAALTESDHARPLVLMAPKSLLRNPRVASPAADFASGTFKTVLEQPGSGGRPDRVDRLILCTGKVAVDLEEALSALEEAERDWIHVVRVEQLYPFPKDEIAGILKKYANASEIVWLQEEPKNMGAWSYIEPRLRAIAPRPDIIRYIGRPERASTASGYQNVHSYEQQQIIAAAMKQRARETQA